MVAACCSDPTTSSSAYVQHPCCGAAGFRCVPPCRCCDCAGQHRHLWPPWGFGRPTYNNPAVAAVLLGRTSQNRQPRPQQVLTVQLWQSLCRQCISGQQVHENASFASSHNGTREPTVATVHNQPSLLNQPARSKPARAVHSELRIRDSHNVPLLHHIHVLANNLLPSQEVLGVLLVQPPLDIRLDVDLPGDG